MDKTAVLKDIEGYAKAFDVAHEALLPVRTYEMLKDSIGSTKPIYELKPRLSRDLNGEYIRMGCVMFRPNRLKSVVYSYRDSPSMVIGKI